MDEQYIHNDKLVQGQNIAQYQHITQIFHGPQDTALSPTKPQRVWNIPYLRNGYFTGREEILTELHARFKANNATALSQRHAMSGLGGIGKTQTAVEYAYRYEKDYQAVLWARAESHEALTSSYVEIARLLDLPQKDEKDQTIIMQAVKRWLQDNHGWLLILDNADEPKIVREFLPTRCAGHLLLTTRAQALGGLAQRIEVDTFAPELGAFFLLRRATIIEATAAIEKATPEDREVATKISEELGGLPLALDQAGAYIEEAQCRLADYLSLYRTHRAKVLKERGGLIDDHPDSVATTWSLSFQRVEQKNAAAADLLRFCAFLAPDAIPEEIITAGAEHLGPVLQAAANDSMALNKAIAILGAYSLIQRDPAEKTLSIHRLVQVVLRDAMGETEKRSWAEQVILSVNMAFPDSHYDTWSQCKRLLSQAWTVTQFIEQYQIVSEDAEGLLQKMAHYLWDRGRYAEAEPLYQLLLHLREQCYGPEHPGTAWGLHGLGDLYWRQGKYIEAEPLLLRSIQIVEQQFGPEDLGVAHMLFGLATLYRRQGKDAQSEQLYQREIQIVEQQLGSGSPKLIAPLSSLAILYHHPNRYAEAEQLYQRALQICQQQLGSEHYKIGLPLLGLATLYREQGKGVEAELLYQQTLQIWEQYFGPEHPQMAQSLIGLARLYHHQGRYAEAERLYQRALTISEKALGPQHPNTQQAHQNYANLLRAMGCDEEAKQLEEKQ